MYACVTIICTLTQLLHSSVVFYDFELLLLYVALDMSAIYLRDLHVNYTGSDKDTSHAL